DFKAFFENFSSAKFDIVCFRALPKKALSLLNLKKVLCPPGYLIRMFSKIPKNEMTIMENYQEVCRWNGILSYLKLNRSVVLYQITNYFQDS
ncbi:MAG: hypothetical protein ACP5U1_00525, partial [Desulfomonilaceae bacterium]